MLDVRKFWEFKRSHLSNEKGFSLIHAAVGLVVLGIMSSGALSTYLVYSKATQIEDTRGDMANVQIAINHYFYNNAHYPCPASLVADKDDPNFGEAADCTLASLKLCSDDAWMDDGVCKTSDTANSVIIGAIPFSDISMTFKQSLDQWNNRILYAVTHQQTSTATFTLHLGALRVSTQDDPTAAGADGIPNEFVPTTNGVPDPIDFILVSGGDNGAGHYDLNGQKISNCPLAAAGLESENCDLDNFYLLERHPQIEATGARSLDPGPNYFDDQTRYQASPPYTSWFPAPTNTDYIMTLATKIGIGTTTPKKNIHVKGGDIRVDNLAKAKNFCDNDFTECFPPEVLTGTLAQMQCDPLNFLPENQAVMRLATNKVFCMSMVNSSLLAISGDAFAVYDSWIDQVNCYTSSKFVAGLNNDGTPICLSP